MKFNETEIDGRLVNPYAPPRSDARGTVPELDRALITEIRDKAGKALMFVVGGVFCCAPLAIVGISAEMQCCE